MSEDSQKMTVGRVVKSSELPSRPMIAVGIVKREYARDSHGRFDSDGVPNDVKEFVSSHVAAFRSAGGTTKTVTAHSAEVERVADHMTQLRLAMHEVTGKQSDQYWRTYDGLEKAQKAAENVRDFGGRLTIAYDKDKNPVAAVDSKQRSDDTWHIGNLGSTNQVAGAATAAIVEVAGLAAAKGMGITAEATGDSMAYHQLVGGTVDDNGRTSLSAAQTALIATLGKAK